MENKQLLECISFFNKLSVFEEEVTTSAEHENACKAVVVQYHFENEHYITKRLYYKSSEKKDCIHKPEQLETYFKNPFYWLNFDYHDWPQPSGAEIEHTVINDMYDGDNPKFEKLLKKIANNSKTGYLQQITAEGRPQQYGFNLENNNHWHDLIILVKYIINKKGEIPPKEYFSRLVFNWKNSERLSLSPQLGSRALIVNMAKNISVLQSKLIEMDIINLLESKKQIILQGPPGTGKTYTAKDIAENIIFGEVSIDKKEQKKRLEESEQFELVQFHPSYSYEDFVRGITAKSDGKNISYETENKILTKFAINANNGLSNYNNEFMESKWVVEQSKIFIKEYRERERSLELESSDFNMSFQSSISYANNEINYVVYKDSRSNTNYPEQYTNVLLNNIIEAYSKGVRSIDDLKETNLLGSHVPDYTLILNMRVLDAFKSYLDKNIKSKNKYILIIDEINRANLPSVLGELIYALEYRGEKVESMYAIDDDASITIPENLYIIGTMNTADRSVGHIDYAIKRRFAFVDVLPNEELIKNEKARELFKLIEVLFIKREDEKSSNSNYLASDFDYKDVQLGHSYFIVQNEQELKMKLKFEIIPILREYVKDGLLLDSANEVIDKLEKFEC